MKLKYVSVDRLEGEFAICIDDTEKTHKINIKKLPKGVKEGDVLKVLKNGYELDKKETKKRREEIFSLQEEIFGDD